MLIVGLGMTVLLLLAAVALIMQAMTGAARAAASADLAALAAADAARGLIPGDPCAVAAEAAARNRARLLTCGAEGSSGQIVQVRAAVDIPGPWGPATARSRAGPPP